MEITFDDIRNARGAEELEKFYKQAADALHKTDEKTAATWRAYRERCQRYSLTRFPQPDCDGLLHMSFNMSGGGHLVLSFPDEVSTCEQMQYLIKDREHELCQCVPDYLPAGVKIDEAAVKRYKIYDHLRSVTHKPDPFGGDRLNTHKIYCATESELEAIISELENGLHEATDEERADYAQRIERLSGLLLMQRANGEYRLWERETQYHWMKRCPAVPKWREEGEYHVRQAEYFAEQHSPHAAHGWNNDDANRYSLYSFAVYMLEDKRCNTVVGGHLIYRTTPDDIHNYSMNNQL